MPIWNYSLKQPNLLFIIYLRISFFSGDLVFTEKAKNKIYAELKVQTEQISALKDNVQVQNDNLNDINNTKQTLQNHSSWLKEPIEFHWSLDGFNAATIKTVQKRRRCFFLNLIKESATRHLKFWMMFWYGQTKRNR
jgi:hypothetical protein